MESRRITLTGLAQRPNRSHFTGNLRRRPPGTVIVPGRSCTWITPSYGAVVERLFGTANTQFVHNLAGNTQLTKHVRQVTKAVDPKQHALWTLGDLYAYLTQWAYQVYDTTLHPALDMPPLEAFQRG